MNLAFWSTAILLLAGALLFVLPPLLRPGQRASTGPSRMEIYREQRRQMDAELAAGTLTPEQHEQALRELQDRVVAEVGDAEDAPAPSRAAPRASVLAVALLVPLGAMGLYALIGKPSVLAPATQSAAGAGGAQGAPHTLSREQMEEMVERLAEKLKKSPNDAEGWHMLARSYAAFNRLPESAQAYDKAAQLAPRDAQLLTDYADVLAMLNGRSLEGRPMELVNAALQIDPKQPKALSLAGTAAFNRGDFTAAAATWQKLLAVLPPESEQVQKVKASIAQAEASRGGAAPVPTAPAATAGASVEGNVSVADALKGRIPAGATLFVFARAVEGPRMPLAIVKVPAGEFPYRFRLDDSQAMTPQFKLSGQPQVMLAARISRSGNATPQSGDLMGTLGPVQVGTKDIKLVIDGVVP